jgi:polysaccharide export outer membrane protein
MKSKVCVCATLAFTLHIAAAVLAQQAPVVAPQPPAVTSQAPAVAPQPPAAAPQAPPAVASYVVGPQDVLVITSYDQPELTGKFTIETDGSFTYPLIGRVQAGGLTLRAVEDLLKADLVSKGFFKAPQVTVTIAQYRSQKIHIVGEVRTPGTYALSGDMRLVEVLALAGSSTAMASGEVVIVHESTDSERVDLRELENGDLSRNVLLMSGDTIFVQRAESVYVFGQVRNPGAYPFRQKKTTVLQALSLAGGVTDRGSTTRIQIVRIVDGEKKELRVEMDDLVEPRDTIIVPERFF